MPNLSRKLSRLKKILCLPSLKKKSGFLNKALRPRLLRSLAPPMAFGRWRHVGLLGKVFNSTEFHFSEVTSFQIGTLIGNYSLRHRVHTCRVLGVYLSPRLVQ